MKCRTCKGTGITRPPRPVDPAAPIKELAFDPGEECEKCGGLGQRLSSVVQPGKGH